MAYRCGLDAGGTVELVTRGSLGLLGRLPAELAGTKYSDLVHPADRKERWERVQAALIERRPCSIEYRVATKLGEVRWVLDVSHGVYASDGGLEAVEGFITDVTARKRLEEQLLHAQKLEGIGRLAGGIAHDFNNLLGAILGYSDLAKSGLSNDDERRTDIEQIESAARRAGELTRQLLSFARKQVVEPRVLDLSSLLLRVDNLLRRVLGEDVELATVLPQRLWSIHADPGQLEQVLVNLAINARDAMPDGGKLAIEARNGELDHVAAERFGVVPGSYVELEVIDSGVGMTDEVKTHLFEPFFTTKETGKGTGLGLATVYGVVVQAGGGIRVESQAGEGTAFSLVFPRAVGEPSSLSSTTPSGPIPRGWETVLVVEDHALVRRATVRALEGQGYQVLVASSGSEALSVIGSTKAPIDLLVTDMVMPDMSGKQLAERLTEICPQLKVLFVSGYADITFLADPELHAQVAFLPKPFTPSALGRKVREVLDALAS
ncbi:MAG: response regulator [Myxococcales bacterium]|nr:response regulator [Myxococcales bacterium]